MLKWLLSLLAAAGIHAAVLRGVVLENQTGRPLSRALVEVQPVPGTAGAAKSARTDLAGVFEISGLPPGQYFVSASRPGFFKLQYGQREWNSAGRPVAVDESEASFINIRLPRFGAITGKVLDEEDIGLPAHDVVAYRNTHPPELVAHAVSDDRGIYRLSGLEPGVYLVRTAGKRYEEGDYIPTFAKDAESAEQARTVAVDLDRTSEGIDVRPAQGWLFEIAGEVVPQPMPGPAKVTFVSDTGRQVIETADAFRFPPVPRGKYEIYAESLARDRSYLRGGYLQLSVDRNDAAIRLNMAAIQLTRIFISVGDGPPLDSSGFQLLARRRDLAGVTEPQTLKIAADRTELAPGRWELMLLPAPGYCVTSFEGPQSKQVAPGHPDGWNEVMIGWSSFVRFRLSNHPGAIHGVVLGADGKPAAGARVFLEAYDTQTRQRLLDPRVAVADLQGRYQFFGLAPGDYRILSTFEYQKPGAEVFDRAGALTVQIEEGRDKAQDLKLYELQ